MQENTGAMRFLFSIYNSTFKIGNGWHVVCANGCVRIFIFILLSFRLLTSFAFAKDSLQVTDVLQRIRQLQVKTAGDFPRGMFPSYREYDHRKGVFKNDDNIFYTGLVVMTLRRWQPYLSPADRAVCDTIFAEAAPLYALFRNRQRAYTYNFWRTNPPVVFPDGGWLNLMNKSHALPDDMDDTAILMMAMDADSTTVRQLHQLMQLHTNTGKKQKKSLHKAYRHIPAYSTWFGKRMPVDIDICVLSNVLYLLQEYQVPFSHADSASLQLICTAIDNGDYIHQAAYISPHYGRTPVILYHLSRLMRAGHLPELEIRKALLIEETRRQLAIVRNPMDKILLAISLLRWDQPVAEELWQTDTDLFSYLERNDFTFFMANMAAILPDPVRLWISSSGTGRFSYYCPAYNEVLLLEYLMLQRH